MRLGASEFFPYCDGELSLAGVGRIVESTAGAVCLGGFEKETALNAVREAGEAGLAVDIGADFEVELAGAGESVGDMNLDSGSIERCAGCIGDDEISRAGADAAVNDGDGLRIRRWSGGLGSGNGAKRQQEQDRHGVTDDAVVHGTRL